MLLGLNGLRVSEACSADIENLGFERSHRTLRVVGKATKPAVIPLYPGRRGRSTWPSASGRRGRSCSATTAAASTAGRCPLPAASGTRVCGALARHRSVRARRRLTGIQAFRDRFGPDRPGAFLVIVSLRAAYASLDTAADDEACAHGGCVNGDVDDEPSCNHQAEQGGSGRASAAAPRPGTCGCGGRRLPACR